MPLIDGLQNKKLLKQGRKKTGPVWQGPEKDGITFSLLSRFLACRERFRLLVVEGLKPAPRFNHRIEYGSMWHVCEEHHAKGQGWMETTLALTAYCQELCRKYPLQQGEIQHWSSVCATQFPLYVEHWANHPDVLDRKPLLQEQVFDVPYRLPSGRTVRLRGKWDSVDLIGKGKDTGVYLQENKTRGEIIERQIKSQLTFDLQTMMYLIALENWFLPGKCINRPPAPILGVRFNVVRRPLSGGKGSIRPHKEKATKKKITPAESGDHFFGRLSDIIRGSPEEYFMRWKVEISAADIQRFKQECLDPILEQLCDWWDYMLYFGKNDKGPFSVVTTAPGIHWRHPFGVYNVLDEGGSSELDEYLASGSEAGLVRTGELFPELS